MFFIHSYRIHLYSDRIVVYSTTFSSSSSSFLQRFTSNHTLPLFPANQIRMTATSIQTEKSSSYAEQSSTHTFDMQATGSLEMINFGHLVASIFWFSLKDANLRVPTIYWLSSMLKETSFQRKNTFNLISTHSKFWDF